jgi:bifunctional N-acetylglucosamine-1-phosphate-uridyltransferase/glucosamine-1-phosphate-acetyltransferase GlmU-like protein
MVRNKCIITILAAGMGKRMNSDIPKVLHLVDGVPMIVRILGELKKLKIPIFRTVIVVGNFGNVIQKTILEYMDNDELNLEYAIQEKALGTGDAVLCSLPLIDDDAVNLIVNGDNPMLKAETVTGAFDNFMRSGYELQILAIEAMNPGGCGRIINEEGKFMKIVEERDCSDLEKGIRLINCGIYLALGELLKMYIPKIKNNNSQGEYYLTDIVELANGGGCNIGLYVIDSNKELEVVNINTQEQLTILNNILRV